MKKILLSTVAVATLATSVNASTSSEIKALKAQMAKMMQKIQELESKQAKRSEVIAHEKKASVVKSKAPVLKLSGKHYLGFVSDKEKNINKFETRRNYLQVKAYFKENPKDYMRVTLDTHHEATGDWKVRLKYAYLYLDSVLPYTGVEIGQAHRPWIDYEEHHGWFYRSISKVLVEESNGAHFTNSADLGINFKTKTEYFSSEFGLFNGEGYHGKTDDNKNLSGEWRVTGHLLGTGKRHVHKSDTFADVSFFGQYNTGYKETATSGEKDDFVWYGLHAVYNQPEFLISAQYIKATEGGVNKEGDGYSVNGEYRFMPNWNLLARYDNFKLDSGIERERKIAGVAYQYNKNVEFIANYLNEEVDNSTTADALMLTAEVNW